MALCSCAICNAPGILKCQQCKAIHYCSKECQQADWALHKILCTAYRDQSPRPGATFRRAIFFDERCDKPELIWVECKPMLDLEVDDRPWEKPVIEQYILRSPPQTSMRLSWLNTNPLRARQRGKAIEFSARDTYGIDGSKINNAIHNVTHGNTLHSWRGPIITMRQNAHIHDRPNRYEDITLEDFRDIVDYFLMYCRVDPSEVPQSPPRKIKGVKVNCVGDMKAYSVPQFTSVDVPIEHPAFHVTLSDLSQSLGLPLHLHKYTSDPKWNSIEDSWTRPGSNDIAASLMMEPDLEVAHNWGTIPVERWMKDSRIRSVLLVRDDRKDLTVQQAEALCTYCESKIQPAMKVCLDNPGRITRSEVMKMITPVKYKEFFAYLCEERSKRDEKWRGKLSPI